MEEDGSICLARYYGQRLSPAYQLPVAYGLRDALLQLCVIVEQVFELVGRQRTDRLLRLLEVLLVHGDD